MDKTIKFAALLLVGLFTVGPAWAAKGGKPGGGGGGGSSDDPCATTSSYFPSIVYMVSSGKRNSPQQEIYLASADGACNHKVMTLDEFFVTAPMRLYVDEQGSGFVAALVQKQQQSFRVLVLDFQIGTGNSVSVTVDSPKILLESTWDGDAGTGTTLENIGLSPEGSHLLITATEGTGVTFTSKVLACNMIGVPCAPDTLLESEVVDGSFWFWEAAPSVDPTRFFVTNIYEGEVPFPRNHVTMVSKDDAGKWALSDTPLNQSDNSLFNLDADPYDKDRVVWRDSGQPFVTPQFVKVCKLNESQQCGEGSWQLDDVNLPTWSRYGLLAQPEHQIPSLLVRGSTSNGKVAYFETVNGEILNPLAVASSNFWDAY